MKSSLRTVNDHGTIYHALGFVCPGCIAGGPKGYAGFHMLAVNTPYDIGKPSWEWDGNLETPTLSPSILTLASIDNKYPQCHSFLKNGIFEFLSDCSHPLAGQKIPIPDLPDWAVSDDG